MKLSISFKGATPLAKTPRFYDTQVQDCDSVRTVTIIVNTDIKRTGLQAYRTQDKMTANQI